MSRALQYSRQGAAYRKAGRVQVARLAQCGNRTIPVAFRSTDRANARVEIGGGIGTPGRQCQGTLEGLHRQVIPAGLCCNIREQLQNVEAIRMLRNLFLQELNGVFRSVLCKVNGSDALEAAYALRFELPHAAERLLRFPVAARLAAIHPGAK